MKTDCVSPSRTKPVLLALLGWLLVAGAQAQNVVTVTRGAQDPREPGWLPDKSAFIAGQNGTFIIARTGSTAGSVTVHFGFGFNSPAQPANNPEVWTSGTGWCYGSGDDFEIQANGAQVPYSRDTDDGTVVIAAGQSSVTVTIVPYEDDLCEQQPYETIGMTLKAGTGYSVGTPAGATLTLIDGPRAAPYVDYLPGTPYYPSVNEGGTMSFHVNRTVPCLQLGYDLVWDLYLMGSADYGSDYTLSLPAGTGVYGPFWAWACADVHDPSLAATCRGA
jgi:hypothetical protein